MSLRPSLGLFLTRRSLTDACCRRTIHAQFRTRCNRRNKVSYDGLGLRAVLPLEAELDSLALVIGQGLATCSALALSLDYPSAVAGLSTGSEIVRKLEDKALLILVAAVTLVFGWVLWPFSGAILWAAIFAVLFASLHRRILRIFPRWPSLAATATLLVVLLLVILPVATLIDATAREASGVYQDFRAGELGLDLAPQRLRESLPSWVIGFADRLGLPNAVTLREKIAAAVMQSGESSRRPSLYLGQMTVGFFVSLFVMGILALLLSTRWSLDF